MIGTTTFWCGYCEWSWDDRDGSHEMWKQATVHQESEHPETLLAAEEPSL